MDRKGFASEVGQSESSDVLKLDKKKKKKKPSVLVEYEPEVFDPLGIFQHEDGFLCLICNRKLSTPQGSLCHSKGREHGENLPKVNNSYSKVAGMFACKLCPSYLAADWRSFLFHFQEPDHGKKVDNKKNGPFNGNVQNPRVSYVTLEKNQIIEYDAGSFFCCCCAKMMTGWNSVVDHIRDKQHEQKQKTRNLSDYDRDHPENESQKLVKHCLCHISASMYYCYLCERSIYGLKNCHQHMDGFNHKILKARISMVDKEKHIINYGPLSERLKPIKNSNKKATKPVQDMLSKSWVKLMRTNLITGPYSNGKYRCKLCGCSCPGMPHVAEHVSGKQHRHLMKQACGESPSFTKSEETSERSSSSCESTGSSSDSWQLCERESESCESSENPSDNWENVDGVSSDSWETISIKSSVSELRGPTLFKIPGNLVPLISEHLLQKREKELYCVACKAHLRGLRALVDHTNSKYHVAALQRFRAKIIPKNQKLLSTSESDSAASSTVNPQIKKPLQAETKSQKDEEPADSSGRKSTTIPLLEPHLLEHFEDDILCLACKVHFTHVNSYIEHINSKSHRAMLDKYRTEISNEDKSVGKTFKGNTVLESSTPAVKESSLMNIPQNLLSRIAIHSLKHLEEKAEKSAVGIRDKSKQQNNLKNSTFFENSAKLLQNQSHHFKNRQMKRGQPQRQNKNQMRGYSFDPKLDPKYLSVDLEHIYKVNPEKMRIMKSSCQLCFPKTSTEIYCLICERSVASNPQNFHDHICSTAHTQYLAEAEQDDKRFIPYPEEFSDLSLAKEFMRQTSVEETIQCLACDETVVNDDALISEHIELDSHKERKQVWNVAMEKILQDTLAKTESTWYNIQKYCCQPCNVRCNTEYYFAEHIDTRQHNYSIQKLGTSRNKLVYDACIPCATLWLGFSGLYTQHCNQPMHKYLLQSGDYSVCKLQDQVKTLLENSEAEVNKLIELSDQVLTVQKYKADNLLKCLEDTVRPAFPEAKAYPFGSRVSGLGFPDSDIDVFLDCGTYDGIKYTEDSQKKIIMAVGDCLWNNQQLWAIEEILTSSRTPIIKLCHRATELSCDVSFKNGLSVENTKLLKCFMDNYPLCRKLMLFLKKWLYLCNLSGSQYITNYALCWYVIFYLQSKTILPSVASMIAKQNKSKIINGWETGICETFDKCQEEFTFKELLHGFFVFYTNFDYRYSVACPIIGNTIPKQDFTGLHLLPKEMAPYINPIKTKGYNGGVELFRIDSVMCIQDPYDLSHNLTKAVGKFTLNRFKRLCAASADVLKNFKHY